MAFTIVTGVEELDRRLKELGGKGAQRASASALRAGSTVIARKARVMAPVGRDTAQRRKKPADKRIKVTIKVKNMKTSRKGPVIGLKVTVGAPHGHFVVFGVRDRQKGRLSVHQQQGKRSGRRLDGGSDRKVIGGKFRAADPSTDTRNKGTGIHKPNPFFRRAVVSVQGQVLTVTAAKLKERIEAEWKKRGAGP